MTSCYPMPRPAAIAAALAPVFGGLPAAALATHELPAVTVQEAPTPVERAALPNSSEGISASEAALRINVMNTEDTLKYLPSLLVRKRYAGDTQAPLATRTTGINASARSLIYADGVLLSALTGNNNTNASPRWFMVGPREIDRVDVMYGPYAAAYPGNSYGAVTEITTRMPQGLEAGASLTGSWQDFGQYGSSGTYRATQASAWLGGKAGDLSWRVAGNHLDAHSQPLTYLTTAQSATPAAGALPVATGSFGERNRLGAPVQVIGAGNLTDTRQDAGKIRLGYDFTPDWRAVYTFGHWQNRQDARPQTYLRTAAGSDYFGAASGNVNIGGFSYSQSALAGLFNRTLTEQEHRMHSLQVQKHAREGWTWELLASDYRYVQDEVRTSGGRFPAAQDGGPGRITDARGTGWNTLDLKAQQQAGGAHTLSLGLHYDHYRLSSPTHDTADWLAGEKGALFADSRGHTRTWAAWLQDVWRLAPGIKATLGARWESWRAYDGFNFNRGGGAGFAVDQPELAQAGWSPKAALAWDLGGPWYATLALGRALRFPTVGELYQNVQTGTSFTQADPNLRPERVSAAEIALERHLYGGSLRLSLFEERVSDALIAQTAKIAGFALPVNYVRNVDRTRQRGIELSARRADVFAKGLELWGSLTYVDAKILANSSYAAPAGAPGASSAGRRTPYVPTWRATLGASYQATEQLATTFAARYSTRLYATVDNTDVNPSTYQGFEGYLVFDARLHYRVDRRWSAALGVDNLFDQKYFLFHPFPQRTLFAELTFNY
ncbi:MAG: TonB-dependent receptor [Rhodocyclaceae bacterium]|nr:TonB-dependent receptor [Rhodocyclaceae bacterium]